MNSDVISIVGIISTNIASIVALHLAWKANKIASKPTVLTMKTMRI